MSLRIRLEAAPETVQDFELASEQKYWEGIELMTAGHRAAGIYLAGYAVEMWLKAARELSQRQLLGRTVSPQTSRHARSVRPCVGVGPFIEIHEVARNLVDRNALPPGPGVTGRGHHRVR